MNKIKSFSSSNLLYLVATPIGNLKEMSPRALEIISSCDLIAAEDTRNTQQLLQHFSIKKPLFSLHEHNEKSASSHIIEEINNGKKIVYVSDAGYPCISDPGSTLVKECIENDIAISTVCGSSAFLNALCSSGMDSTHFYFHGFLPSKESQASKELETLTNKEETLIFYEAPHRIEKTMNLFYKVLGDRKFVLARELTKLNEEFIRGNLKEIADFDFASIKGEMVIIIEGNKTHIDENIVNYKEEALLLLSKGLSKKDIVEVLTKFHKSNKNDVYNIVKEL